jgi:hypothetical protein
MSAVAPTHEESRVTPALEVVSVSGPTTAEIEAKEAYRWMLWFGLPMLIAAAFTGACFALGAMWPMAGAILFLIAAIGSLIWLSMSSCTNMTGAASTSGSAHR